MKKLLVVSLFLSLSLLASCQSPSSGEVSLTLDVLGSNETSTFQFSDSTLLDLLDSKYELKVKNAGFSKYVTCIKDICANDEYSWVYYVNDEPMNYGVDVYKLQDGDSFLLSYKKIK